MDEQSRHLAGSGCCGFWWARRQSVAFPGAAPQSSKEPHPPSASWESAGRRFSLRVDNRRDVLLWANHSDLCLQFNVQKSAEPVQPRALLKFPDIYGPRPAVTAPEVINYTDYTLRPTEEPAPASPQAPRDSRLKRQVTEELFILPQNGRGPQPLAVPWATLLGARAGRSVESISIDAGRGQPRHPRHLTPGKQMDPGPRSHSPLFLLPWGHVASPRGLQLPTGNWRVPFKPCVQLWRGDKQPGLNHGLQSPRINSLTFYMLTVWPW